MAFKKTFPVSDESVNSQGFWTRTEGIDIELAKKNCPAFYDHRTWEIPLGHWENHRIENGKYLADLIIDGGNDIEREYIRKIECGDVKCASFGADPKEWKPSSTSLLSGETAPVLWECEVFEISLLPLPSNKNSIALKNESGLVKLSANNIHTIIPDFKQEVDMKSIALKLGLPETATENEILAAITEVQLSKTQAETFRTNALKVAEEGLEGEDKDVFITLSKTNVEQALKFADKQKAAKEPVTEGAAPVNGKVVKDVKLSALVQNAKSKLEQAGNAEDEKNCYDYLQKHDAVELSRIHKDEPERYAQLAADYGKGKRYTGK